MKHAPSTTSSNLRRKQIFGAAYAQCQLFVSEQCNSAVSCAKHWFSMNVQAALENKNKSPSKEARRATC